MQNQRRVGWGEVGTSQDEARSEIKPLSLEVPDVHEAMRLAGAKDIQLSQQGSQGNRRDQSRMRLLCCCGDRGCGIGPMTQIEEVTE